MCMPQDNLKPRKSSSACEIWSKSISCFIREMQTLTGRHRVLPCTLKAVCGPHIFRYQCASRFRSSPFKKFALYTTVRLYCKMVFTHHRKVSLNGTYCTRTRNWAKNLAEESGGSMMNAGFWRKPTAFQSPPIPLRGPRLRAFGEPLHAAPFHKQVYCKLNSENGFLANFTLSFSRRMPICLSYKSKGEGPCHPYRSAFPLSLSSNVIHT